VEDVGLKPQADTLVDWKIAMKREVELLERESAKGVTPQVAGNRLPCQGQRRAKCAFCIGGSRRYTAGGGCTRRRDGGAVQPRVARTGLTPIQRGTIRSMHVDGNPWNQ